MVPRHKIESAFTNSCEVRFHFRDWSVTLLAHLEVDSSVSVIVKRFEKEVCVMLNVTVREEFRELFSHNVWKQSVGWVLESPAVLLLLLITAFGEVSLNAR